MHPCIAQFDTLRAGGPGEGNVVDHLRMRATQVRHKRPSLGLLGLLFQISSTGLIEGVALRLVRGDAGRQVLILLAGRRSGLIESIGLRNVGRYLDLSNRTILRSIRHGLYPLG